MEYIDLEELPKRRTPIISRGEFALIGQLRQPQPSEPFGFDEILFDDGHRSLPCIFAFPLELRWFQHRRWLLLSHFNLRKSQTIVHSKGNAADNLVLEILSAPILIGNNALVLSMRHRGIIDQLQIENLLELQNITDESENEIDNQVSGRESVLNFHAVSTILACRQKLSSKAVAFLKNVSLAGIVVSRSPLFRSQDNTPFFLIELAPVSCSEDDKARVSVIVTGSDSLFYHRMILSTFSYILRKMRVMTLFAGKEDESKVLVFDTGQSIVTMCSESNELHQTSLPPEIFKSFRAESFTIMSAVSQISNSFDENSQVAPINAPINYAGRITAILDHKWKLVEIDEEYSAYLTHSDSYLWSFVYAGQEIILRNVHVSTDDGYVAFICSAYSQLELGFNGVATSEKLPNESYAKSKRFNNICPTQVLLAKSIFDQLQDLETNQDSLTSVFDYLGMSWKRNIYQEFLKSSSLSFKVDFSFKLHTPSSLLCVLNEYAMDTSPHGISTLILKSTELDLKPILMMGNIKYYTDGFLRCYDNSSFLRICQDTVVRDLPQNRLRLLKNFEIIIEIVNQSKNIRSVYLRPAKDFDLQTLGEIRATVQELMPSFESFRVMFIKELIGPTERGLELALIIIGTSFKLEEHEASFKLVDVAETLVTVKNEALCQWSRLHCGQWISVSSTWSELRISYQNNMPIPRIQSLVTRISQIRESSLHDTPLDTISTFIKIQTEDPFTRPNAIKSIESILDESSKIVFDSIYSTFLPYTVSFEAVILSREIKESDCSIVKNERSYELFRDWNIGMGDPGKILFLKVRDTNSQNVLDLFFDLSHLHYPLGLLPGVRAIFYNVALKITKKKSIYGVNIPSSSVRIICSAVQSDEGRVINEMEKISLDSLLRDKSNFRFKYISSLISQTSNMSMSLFYIVGMITHVKEVHWKWTCGSCRAIVIMERCTANCSKQYQNSEFPFIFEAELSCNVRDGTASAMVIIRDVSCVLDAFNFDSDLENSIKKYTIRHGRLEYSDFLPSTSVHDADKSVHVSADQTTDSTLSAFSYHSSMECARLQQKIKTHFSMSKRQNIMFECQSISRKQSWLSSSLKRYEDLLKKLNISDMTVKVNKISMRTLSFTQPIFLCRRLCRPSMVELARLHVDIEKID